MPRKFVYDYYDVHIPRDAFPETPECWVNEGVFDMAIETARHRTRIYAMPCTWTAQLIDDPDSADFHVRVCRKRHRTKRSHFHMLVGMPGYMPDTNYVHRTRGDAEHGARWQAQDFRDQWNGFYDCAEYKVEGNKYNGYEIYRRNAIHPEEVHMTIRVTECFEEDCLEEMEDM